MCTRQGELDGLLRRRRPLHRLAVDVPARVEDDGGPSEHASEADLGERPPATAGDFVLRPRSDDGAADETAKTRTSGARIALA